MLRKEAGIKLCQLLQTQMVPFRPGKNFPHVAFKEVVEIFTGLPYGVVAALVVMNFAQQLGFKNVALLQLYAAGVHACEQAIGVHAGGDGVVDPHHILVEVVGQCGQLHALGSQLFQPLLSGFQALVQVAQIG